MECAVCSAAAGPAGLLLRPVGLCVEVRSRHPNHNLQVDSRGLNLPMEGAKELLIVTQQDKPFDCCLVLRWTAWSLSRPCFKQLATSGAHPAACRSEQQLLHGDSGLPLVLEMTGLYKRRLLLVFEVGAEHT